MTKAKIEELAREKLEIDLEMKTLQARLDAIKAELLKEMGDEDTLETKNFLLTQSLQMRTLADVAKLKEDKIFEKYSKSSPALYFRVEKK